MRPQLVSGFESPRHMRHGGIGLPVHVSATGESPLVVLHELPGMSRSFIEFCRRMAGEGYEVQMPLMLEAPGTRMGAFGSAAFCMSRAFRALFAAGRDGHDGRACVHRLASRPGAARLRGASRPEDRVVGMCLTGGFALACIAEPGVEAAVACRPSFPFLREIRTPGLSDRERETAAARARTLSRPCAKGYRYADDRICRPSHMRAAEALLGQAFERHPDLPVNAHATLTGAEPSGAVFADVLDFLNRRLA